LTRLGSPIPRPAGCDSAAARIHSPHRPAPGGAPAPARMAPSNALPPGPKGSLLFGSLRDFSARRLDFFLDVARTYGDIVGYRFGPRRVFQLGHPDLIEQVLVTDARHYVKHFGARVYTP